MDLIKAINNRRSIRDFKDKRVQLDDLLFLCELGAKAPSAGNLQDYRFIITRDRKKIAALPDACMDQDWISYATGVIVVCSQPNIQIKWYGEQGPYFSNQNASAAAQNILLGATSLNLAATWVSGFNKDKVHKIFGINKDAKAEIIIPIGYPSAKPEPKAENPLDVMIYFNTYGNLKADLNMLHKDYSLKLKEHIDEGSFVVKRLIRRNKQLQNKKNYSSNKNNELKKNNYKPKIILENIKNRLKELIK